MSGIMSGAQIVLKVLSTALSSTLGLGTADDPIIRDYTQNLSNGTGANQASNQWHDQRTLGVSATENLDLSGVLVNAFGVVLIFTKIKALIIHAATTNTNDVLVGGAGANAWLGGFVGTGDVVKVKPGGTFVNIAPDVNGMAVVAATGDLLKIANSAGGSSVVYDVIIIGTD